MNPESATAFMKDIATSAKEGQPHFVTSIKPSLHKVEGQQVFMDRCTYEKHLLSSRIPIFSASQINEAAFKPPLRPEFNVYLGRSRPIVYPEISYGEVLPPAGTQYLLISYMLPIDTSCISCEKQTFENIESAIALNPQTMTTIIEVPEELPMPPIDAAALQKRGVTLKPVSEQHVLAKRREMSHSGKRMDMLKQRMLEELKARARNQEPPFKKKSCNAKSKGKKASPKVPPIFIRLGKTNKVSDTQPVRQATCVKTKPMEPVSEANPNVIKFSCDFCGMVKTNKSLISEHIRRCKIRLQKLEEAFERKLSPTPCTTSNPVEVLLRCMRNSI